MIEELNLFIDIKQILLLNGYGPLILGLTNQK